MSSWQPQMVRRSSRKPYWRAVASEAPLPIIHLHQPACEPLLWRAQLTRGPVLYSSRRSVPMAAALLELAPDSSRLRVP